MKQSISKFSYFKIYPKKSHFYTDVELGATKEISRLVTKTAKTLPSWLHIKYGSLMFFE